MEILQTAGIALFTAIITSIITTWVSHQYHIRKQNRSLIESHYSNYLNGLNEFINSKDASLYSSNRNKLLIIASPEVISSILELEKNIMKPRNNDFSIEEQNIYITAIIVNIRKDLKINNKNFPTIDMISPTRKNETKSCNEESQSSGITYTFGTDS